MPSWAHDNYNNINQIKIKRVEKAPGWFKLLDGHPKYCFVFSPIFPGACESAHLPASPACLSCAERERSSVLFIACAAALDVRLRRMRAKNGWERLD